MVGYWMICFTMVMVALLVLIFTRNQIFELFRKLDRLDESIRLQREFTHKIIKRYESLDRENAYAAFLMNDMVAFRNEAFRDAALAAQYDNILLRWKAQKDK